MADWSYAMPHDTARCLSTLPACLPAGQNQGFGQDFNPDAAGGK